MKNLFIQCGRYLSIYLLLIIFSCDPLIAPYDQYAYTQTTAIKVDALNAMDLSTEEYDLHQKEVAAVQTSIDKIYEYDRNRPKNNLTVKHWDLLKDTTGHLWGGFISRWKHDKKLNVVFIENEK